jgi:hypothetical protein
MDSQTRSLDRPRSVWAKQSHDIAVSMSAFSIRCRCCACAARLQLDQQLCRSKVIKSRAAATTKSHCHLLRAACYPSNHRKSTHVLSLARAKSVLQPPPLLLLLPCPGRVDKSSTHPVCAPTFAYSRRLLLASKSTHSDRYRLLGSPVHPQPRLCAPLCPRPLSNLDVCALLIASQ